MSVKFLKMALDLGNACEACSVFDVDNNGVLDIVCGEYWYEGPDFTKKHKICDITYEHGYVWDFSDYPMDVNGDGYMDIITGSWWGNGIYWRENPGKEGGEWKTHLICELKSIETIRFYDIDGDGVDEIFPNCPGMPAFFLKLVTDENNKGTGVFKTYVIGQDNAGHGMGLGDIDGDGKTEVLLSKGFLHMPDEGPLSGPWEFYGEYETVGGASVPMLVLDVNGDGLNDFITSTAHGYGLYWYEQNRDVNGLRRWTRHVIDGAWSQYHDMQLADIDGDGELELITGKRYKAHNGNDPGDAEPVFICYYKLHKGNFYRHVIDFGNPEDGHSGLGIYFWLADLNNDSKLDIIAPGKEGLYLFTQV